MKKILFVMLVCFFVLTKTAFSEYIIREGFTPESWYGSYDLDWTKTFEVDIEGGTKALIFCLRSKTYYYAVPLVIIDQSKIVPARGQFIKATEALLCPRDDNQKGIKLQLLDKKGKILYEHTYDNVYNEVT